MRVAAALMVAFVAVVAGCGEDDDGTTTANGAPVTTHGGTATPLRVPDRFGTATVSSAAFPGCDSVVGGDTITVGARGYVPGAEVIVSLQIVEAESSIVATVAASEDGAVAVPVALPDESAGTIGGFEVTGDAPDGLLLNEALLVFGDADSCGAGG